MSITLTLHGSPVATIFDLLGHDENDMTASLGWVLRSSRPFLDAFIRAATGRRPPTHNAVVRLQAHGADGGFTDVEIEIPEFTHVVVEAKRTFAALPTESQLRRYRPRLREDTQATQRIVVISGTTPGAAKATLPPDVAGVPVEFISWRAVRRIALSVQGEGTHEERRWVREFTNYVEEIIGMSRHESNWVYVVSIGAGTWDGWPVSQREIVEKQKRYFHRVGGGWPAAPPNYLAFRYDGKLQAIHHVDSVEVTTDLTRHFEGAPQPDADIEPHFVYRLGPAIRPSRDVSTGPGIRQAMRVWCYLDTLLTCSTITEALAATKRRQSEVETEP